MATSTARSAAIPRRTVTSEDFGVLSPIGGILVRSRRLELPRLAAQRPQRCASTNSATTALCGRSFAPKRRSERGCSKGLGEPQAPKWRFLRAPCGEWQTPSAQTAQKGSSLLIDFFGDEHAKLAVFDIDFAARNQGVIGIDGQRIVFGLLQFDDRAAPHAQEMVDGHDRRTEFNGDIDFNIVQRAHK